jgi:AcrR family transcriptional regulator
VERIGDEVLMCKLFNHSIVEKSFTKKTLLANQINKVSSYRSVRFLRQEAIMTDVLSLDTEAILQNKRERILVAAHEEIIANGILGFRIIDVSDKAECAVSLVYRHFGDRNGLIKAVLSRIVTQHVDRWEILRQQLRETTTRDVDAILKTIPTPNSEYAKMVRWLRVQAMAASVGEPEIHNYLMQETQRYHNVVKDLLIDIRAYLGMEADCDLDALSLLWCSLGLLLASNDLLIEGQLDDDRFRAFLLKILELN